MSSFRIPSTLSNATRGFNPRLSSLPSSSMDYGRQGLILQAPSKVLNVSPPSTHQQMDQNTAGMRYSNLSHIEVAYSLGANDASASYQEISAIIGRSRPAISKTTKMYEIKPFSRVSPPTEKPKKLDR